MPQKNMYETSVKQWNPFVGCKFNCEYCKTSFQRQAKRQKQNCLKCYEYTPHEHPERLKASLPATEPGEFIFTCANADISFCSTVFLNKIVDRIKKEPAKTFLIQSKNPKTFARIKFPDNVILGTTIETNRDDIYKKIANAPAPSRRFEAFKVIDHKRKMVTCEPVMDFDLDIMIDWITQLKPELVWIGYDSKKGNLMEPSREKAESLGNALERKHIRVIYKTMRESRVYNEQTAEIADSVINKIKEKTMSKHNKDGKRAPRLTTEQKKQLKSAYSKNENIVEVAKEVGIGYSQAYNFLAKAKDAADKTSKTTKVNPVMTPKVGIVSPDNYEEMTLLQLLAHIKEQKSVLSKLEVMFKKKEKAEQQLMSRMKTEIGIK